MWMECSPGGRFLMSSVILTPFGELVSWAVPTFWPSVFLNSTVTGLELARLWDSWAWAAEARANTRHTPHRIVLIGITSLIVGFEGLWALREAAPNYSNSPGLKVIPRCTECCTHLDTC